MANISIVLVNKPQGLTPLQTIQKLQKLKPEFQTKKIGYAGRLDPMAEGLLILLIGDENKKRKEYERLPKTYEFEVLLGIETDSYDILGIVTNIESALPEDSNLEFRIENVLRTFIGTSEQLYPPYSSARVDGKPLFYWAREGKIDQITMPKKHITIYSLELNQLQKVALATIKDEIIDKIQAVNGKFRQLEIMQKWNHVFQQHNNQTFIKLSCTISCSSGTYVRGVAHQLGKKLGTDAIAWKINRTKIGPYSLANAVHFT